VKAPGSHVARATRMIKNQEDLWLWPGVFQAQKVQRRAAWARSMMPLRGRAKGMAVD